MELRKIEIRSMSRSGFVSAEMDAVCHRKVLPWFSVVQAAEGSYEIQLGNQSVKSTGRGGFFLAPSGVQQTIVHHADPSSGIMNCRWLFVDAVINDIHRLDDLYVFPTVLSKNENTELQKQFDALFSTDDLFEVYSLCYRILQLLVRFAKPRSVPRNSLVQGALDYIEKNYRQEICMERLADHLHCSQSNLSAAFRKAVGVSPMAYVTRYRMSLAAEYLRETSLSVREISESVGVSDALYFSKLFRKLYQMPPTVYRSVCRETIQQE